MEFRRRLESRGDSGLRCQHENEHEPIGNSECERHREIKSQSGSGNGKRGEGKTG